MVLDMEALETISDHGGYSAIKSRAAIQNHGPRDAMITDRDIWATAKMLVDQHGAEAPIHAAMRADALLERGDVDGQAVWKRILHAVEEILHLPEPAPSESGEAGLRIVAAKLIEMFGADAKQYALDRASRLDPKEGAEAVVVWRAIAIIVEESRQGRSGGVAH